jgi:DNA-binding MarR family transcriptional regulator
MTTATAGRAAATRTARRSASAADREAAAQLADATGRLVRMLRRSYLGMLGPAAAAALATLDRRGPLRLGELADSEGVTPAALSRVVAALERDGLVRRTADPADRRSAFVEPTARGRDTVRAILAARAAVLVERITDLSVADRQTLVDGLAVLDRLVTAAPAPPEVAGH